MVDDPMLVKFLFPFRFLCVGNNEPTEVPVGLEPGMETQMK